MCEYLDDLQKWNFGLKLLMKAILQIKILYMVG